jgi:hypothetical protein
VSVKKRSDQRHGHRSAAEQARASKVVSDQQVRIPNAKTWWSQAAKDMYASLKRSPQSKFYTDADWQYAQWSMFVMTVVEKDPTAMKLATFDGMLSKLLVDETSRRKANIEITTSEPEEENTAEIYVMDKYQAMGE